MDQPISTRPARIAALHDALEQRILVLDGAMGTMIQRDAPDRGRSTAASASATSARDLRGNNDLLDAHAARR